MMQRHYDRLCEWLSSTWRAFHCIFAGFKTWGILWKTRSFCGDVKHAYLFSEYFLIKSIWEIWPFLQQDCLFSFATTLRTVYCIMGMKCSFHSESTLWFAFFKCLSCVLWDAQEGECFCYEVCFAFFGYSETFHDQLYITVVSFLFAINSFANPSLHILWCKLKELRKQ